MSTAVLAAGPAAYADKDLGLFGSFDAFGDRV